MSKRNYGIDLLRIVLMYMVCILHVTDQGGIRYSYAFGSCEFNIFLLVRIISVGAVDGFALISGYMAMNKPQKYEKIVNMWFQVFFYSFILTLAFTIVGTNEYWPLAEIIKAALPVTFGKFWYFTAFFALFFIVPVLNAFLFNIDEACAKKCIVFIIVLFSCVGLLADAFKTEYGYSAFWLIILYCLGGLAKKVRLFSARKTSTLLLMWSLCILITWIISVCSKVEKLVNYNSPTIILGALILVIIFSRFEIKGNIIGMISPLVFGIYLFQLNGVVYNQLLKDAFVFVTNKNIFISLGCDLLFSALLFGVGLFVEFIRQLLAKWLGIQMASQKIVEMAERMLSRIVVLLN